MGKFRVRVNTNNKKRARWPKGQSSSSNPEKTKHRDAAKALRGFSTGNSREFAGGQSKLTSENLLKHTAALGDVDDVMTVGDGEEDETLTFGQTAKTFDTFASDWTQCTNVSFNKIITRFRGDNAHHKEMLAVLAAVTEIIKSKGGEESSMEYFAALLTALEVADTEDSLAAILALLGMVIKSLPKEILQAKFSYVSKLLLDLLSKHSNSENNSMLRSLIGCLSVILRAQTLTTWSNSSTKQIYDSLLAFVTHSRPKLRKAAQHAVISILKGSYLMTTEDPPKHHPMAVSTSKYCVNLIEENAGNVKNNAILYVLVLLKEILSAFPRSQVKTSCETILKVMTLGNAYVVSCGLRALHGLYSARPPKESLPAELNAQLLTALYDYQPSVNDAQPFIAWLTVQQEALINLGLQDYRMCLAHLPKFFTVTTLRGWLSDKSEVVSASTTAMKALINECLKPHAKEFSVSDPALVGKVFSMIEEGLKYQYHAAWAQVLHLLSVIIDAIGEFTPFQNFMGKCLCTLADLRNSVNFSLTNELDYTVGKAVRKMGPEVVLSFIPLQITGEEKNYDFPRSWLLPVLRENIQNTKMSYFTNYFLPLASVCLRRSQDCAAKSDVIGRKTYELLVYQIWSLLPGFCNGPTDLIPGFKGLARILGIQLNERKELRMDILSSIRQLILKSGTESEENKNELARFAKNFLPILFNLYTTKPEGAEAKGQRLSVFETIKLYLSITSPELLYSMFDIALGKYNNEETDPFVKESLMDLLRIMIPYQDSFRINNLYQLCVKNLASKDHKDQKKAYKALEELCGSNTESCKAFVKAHIPEIESVFLKSLAKSSPPSQSSRLRCLTHILNHLEANDETELEANVRFAYSIVPEVILCIKAVNAKARNGAYNLLVVIGERLNRWEGQVREEKVNLLDDVLRGYLKVILAGLAGEPTLIHCTLLAITRIFYEFKDVFPEDLVELLVNNVCLLSTSKSREVVGATLSFLRVFVSSHNVLKTARYVQIIVKSLVNMSEDCKRHYRLKSRYLLDRIIRKFGYDFVASLVPKNDVTMHKRLRNIKKLHARKSKLEKRMEDNDDDEDDDDEEFRIRGKPKTMEEILQDSEEDDEFMDDDDDKRIKKKKKKAGQQAFISEKENEEILDFLDPSAAQRVTSVKPVNSGATELEKRKKKRSEFKIAPDGRLIIKDGSDSADSDGGSESDDEDSDRDLARKRRYDMKEDSDEENTFQNLISTSAAKKRKQGGSVASSKRTAASGEPAMKYQAGGSGIHRPIDKKKSNTDYGAEYRSKKAKGDVKRKGKPDPYAYVPLQKSSLNKRKKAKYAGQFKGLVKAAKSGAATGRKNKLHDVKRLMKKMKLK